MGVDQLLEREPRGRRGGRRTSAPPAGRARRRRGSRRARRSRPRAAAARRGCGRRRRRRCRGSARAGPRPRAAARRGGRGTRGTRGRTRPGARSGGAPGPSGGAPRIISSCSSDSCSEITARARPARSPKRRNSVPLPTPASAATASIVTLAGPRARTAPPPPRAPCGGSRAASARSGGSAPKRGRAVGHAENVANWTAVRFACYSACNETDHGPDTEPEGHHPMTAITAPTPIPAGTTWTVDPVHSTVGFAVKHMVVSTFRGRFEDYDATLTANEDGTLRLEGRVAADSIAVKDENLAAHLKAPDFFDTERHPDVTFASTLVRADERRADRRRRADDQGPHAPDRGPRHDHRAARHVRRRREGRPRARGDRRPHGVRPRLERAAAQGRLRARQRGQAARQPRAGARVMR